VAVVSWVVGGRYIGFFHSVVIDIFNSTSLGGQAMLYSFSSLVQCSAVQCSAVQFSAVLTTPLPQYKLEPTPEPSEEEEDSSEEEDDAFGGKKKVVEEDPAASKGGGCRKEGERRIKKWRNMMRLRRSGRG
jgi:hypothetical protein